MADSRGKAPGGFRRLPAGQIRDRKMELDDLIMELRRIVDEAGVASDAGEVDEAREQLRTAKELLEDEFLND